MGVSEAPLIAKPDDVVGRGLLAAVLENEPVTTAVRDTQEAIAGKCGELRLIKPSLREFEEQIYNPDMAATAAKS